jgi:hypothetical protein
VMGQHRRCGCVDVLALVIDGDTVDGNDGSGRQLATTVKDALLLAALSPSLALSNYDDGRRRSVDDHGVRGSRRRWAMMGR